MIHYAILDPSGMPIQAGCSRRLPQGAVELPPGLTAERAVAMMWTGEDWQPRPTIFDPAAQDVDGRPRLIWTGLPAGTRCEVIDRTTGGALVSVEPDGTFDVLLGEAGPYRVEITPPPPWLPYWIEVDVA